jgi:hypothetical protein
MTTTSDLVGGKLDIGRVIGQTFSVIGRQPVTILGLSLLLAGLPAAVTLYYMRDTLAAGAAGALGQFTTPFYWIRILIGLFIGAFLAACLFYIAFSEVSGRKVGVGEIASNGAKLFLPLFAVNLLSAIAICFGLILLIIPGLMLAAAWCVAGPALVGERVGITQAFGRSAELTRDNRWRIVGLVLIFFLVVVIIQAVLGAVGLAFSGIGVVLSPARIVVAVIYSGIQTALIYTGLAVLYAQLRELKEGVGGEGLAAVFD